MKSIVYSHAFLKQKEKIHKNPLATMSTSLIHTKMNTHGVQNLKIHNTQKKKSVSNLKPSPIRHSKGQT